MFKVNEYFDGKVKSIAFNSPEGPATIGVMEKGEYEFGTSTIEIMKVVSGKMKVRLPGNRCAKLYKDGDSFEVAKDVKFNVKVEEDSAYICFYK